jgi:DMSO/TMAO reductase YedYZ molybdopterin-dependent catalytic subunit
MVKLPPGQRAVLGLPRFGTNLAHPPPPASESMTIEIVGQVTRQLSLGPGDLADMPRCEVLAGLHCVAGWSAVALRWEGVAFQEIYRVLIEPALVPGSVVRYAVFVGFDGFRSIATIEDVLADNVLIADHLNGQPLTAENGAPVRLVSPDQYGFMSTKYLIRIELHQSEPAGFYHSTRSIQRTLRAVRPHRRARVWQEERHRYLPSWLVRPIYRLLIKLPAQPVE